MSVFQHCPAIYVDVDRNGADRIVAVEQWLQDNSFPTDSGDEALAKCPNPVRHAIAMFGIWRGLAVSGNIAVRALAHAFTGCYDQHDTMLFSHTSYTLGRRVESRVSAGRSVLPSRLLHHFGLAMHKLSVVSPGASTMDKKRRGWSPYSRGRSYDADDKPGLVAEMYEDTYTILRDRGELVRPKDKDVSEFFRVLRPIMSPYFVTDIVSAPQPFVTMVKPRSAQEKRFIPLSLQVGMSWVTPLLANEIKDSLNYSHEWCGLQMEAHSQQREEFALRAMARGKMTSDLMAKFDQTAQCMYLQPKVEPQVTRYIVDNENLMDFSIPGLNGRENLQEQAK